MSLDKQCFFCFYLYRAFRGCSLHHFAASGGLQYFQGGPKNHFVEDDLRRVLVTSVAACNHLHSALSTRPSSRVHSEAQWVRCLQQAGNDAVRFLESS